MNAINFRLAVAAAAFTLAACSPRNPESVTPALAMAPADAPAGAYTLDKAHASLVLRVNHLGFSSYTARFGRFDAQLQFDPARLAASSVNVTIDPASLELDNPPAGFADELRNGEKWLNAGHFPEMKFRSTHAESTGARALRITGDLTLHGATHRSRSRPVSTAAMPAIPWIRTRAPVFRRTAC